MDIKQLRKLVKTGESDSIEFKKSLASLKSAAESLCAFLNTGGGAVYIGITDDGKIVGQQLIDKKQQEIAAVTRKIEPSANIQMRTIGLDGNNDNVVIVLTAEPDQDLVPYTFDSRAFERKGTTTSRMPQARYHQLLMQRTNIPSAWDELCANKVGINHLDEDEITNTISSGVNVGRLPPTVATESKVGMLRRLKLMDGESITNAAVVLFCEGTPRFYRHCQIRLACYRGIEKGDFIDSRHVEGNAFYLLREATNFIERHTSIASHFIPGQLRRVDEPEYPPLAVREALINAISHRDYTVYSGSISVSVYADRLEIISPGMLNQKLTVDQLKSHHESFPRNKNISDVMYRTGMVEKIGIGTQEMVKACKKLGAPEPEFEQRGFDFIVRFWSKHPRVVDTTATVDINNNEFTNRQKEIVLLLRNSPHSSTELMNHLTESVSERTIRNELAKLASLGLIVSTGKGPSTVWHINEKEK